jgi:cellulose synthase operon protein C
MASKHPTGLNTHLLAGLMLAASVTAMAGAPPFRALLPPAFFLCAQENGAVAPVPGQAQLDFANGLFHRGFHEEAIDEYEVYLKAHPDSAQAPAALYRLGEAAIAVAKYEKALDALDRLIALKPDAELRWKAELSRGEVLYYLDQYGEAAETLEPLTDGKIPEANRARAMYYLGRAQQGRGDMDSALAVLRTLAESMPDTAIAPYARYQLALVHVGREELERAALEFSAVANSKADAELRMESRYRAAECYDRLGWFSAAAGAYEQLRADFPDSPYADRSDYGYAWALYHDGQFAEALSAVEKVLEKGDTDPAWAAGLRYLRANCLQQQNKHEDALAIYRELIEEKPDSEFAERSAYKAAWVRYLQGDLEAARKGVTAWLQKYGGSGLTGEAGFLLGTILAAEGNYEDAQQEFRLVAERYPDSEFGQEALYKSGECLAQLGLTEQAAETFEVFVRRYPDSPLTEQAILRAGDAQFNESDFAEAVKRYEEILRNPVTPQVEAETHYRLAITYHNMKKYEESASYFRKLIEKAPASGYAPEARFRIAEYLLRVKNDALQALEAYQAVLDADPPPETAGKAVRGLALARYERKDFDQAAALFLRLMSDYPAVPLNEESYIWTGQYYFEKDAWEKAAKAYQSLLARLPDYPYPERVRFRIAECRENAGKPEEALALYRAVTEAVPGSAKAVDAHYHMARILETQEKLEEAMGCYEAAAGANTGETAARARFRLGELYEAEKAWDKAARSYMRVAILFLHEDLSPRSLWRAGICYEKAGSPDRARKAREEIISDYPESDYAAKVRESLKALADAEPETGPDATEKTDAQP